MKSVLITGCSSGFGLTTAVELAKRRWRVVASMRDPARADRLTAAAGKAGVTVDVVGLDVCSAASISDCVARTLELTGGTLDAVVHNAGIAGAGYFEDVTAEAARRVMETNFFGVLELSRQVLPVMRARRSGRVVVVSSVGAFVAQAGLSMYAASKWAVEGWAESLAAEVAPFGIHVSLVEPGTYKTDIWTSAPMTTTAESAYRPFAEVAEQRTRQLVERFGREPQEVATRIADVLAMRRPRLRNPVGPDSWALWGMRTVLPFRLRTALFGRITGTSRVRV